ATIGSHHGAVLAFPRDEPPGFDRDNSPNGDHHAEWCGPAVPAGLSNRRQAGLRARPGRGPGAPLPDPAGRSEPGAIPQPQRRAGWYVDVSAGAAELPHDGRADHSAAVRDTKAGEPGDVSPGLAFAEWISG